MTAFSVEQDSEIAVVAFDQPNAPVNTLTADVGEELTALLHGLDEDGNVEAIALMSGKPDTFIAGADINQFLALRSAEEARALSRLAQGIVNRVAGLRKPLVVAIHGACLGGGVEVALAARYRIASDAPSTEFRFPEVQLGILPAAGGCQRLPRLVGLRAALEMILTGRSVRPDRALRIGLVDEVVPSVILRDVATAAARRLASGWRPRQRRRGRWLAWLLEGNRVGRWLVFRRTRLTVMARTGVHYPAPYAAIDATRTGLARGQKAGLEREAELFGELAVGPVSRNLVQIFFATTALKKQTGELASGTPRSITRVGVIGSGFMGAGIAGVAALRAGVDVRIRDTNWTRIASGLATARRVLDGALNRRRIDTHEHYRRSALLSGSLDASGFGRRDLVVEAVFEDLAVKRQVIADLEGTASDDCIIASNTSTIPIRDLQAHARRPDRIVGMQFFSPVERMLLVEIIRGPSTADETAAAAAAFAQRMGKTPIVLRDAPGFWVNRILAPYLNEAGWLLEDGVDIPAIDEAMVAVGFPVGPLALIDDVGLDVAAKAADVLYAAFGDRLRPAPSISTLIGAGRLGRKSGGGFYRYEKGKRARPDETARALTRHDRSRRPTPDEITRRPLLAMLNEAARAVSECVVRAPSDGDVGAVLGFGFPPYLGGPLRYIDDLGAVAVVTELEHFAAACGPRFAPADVLVQMARDGATFYGSRP